jgi:hypothetical protein
MGRSVELLNKSRVMLPITLNPGSVVPFLDHIKEAKAVPTKVTVEYLIEQGFTATNDVALPRVLKEIGFLSDSGTPTKRWRQYRGKNGSKVLAAAIKERYRGLFDKYPDAQLESASNIAPWMHSTAGGTFLKAQRATRTFKALCVRADFSAYSPDEMDARASAHTSHVPVLGADSGAVITPGPSLRPIVSQTWSMPGIEVTFELRSNGPLSATSLAKAAQTLATIEELKTELTAAGEIER